MGADLLPDDRLLKRIAAGDAEAFAVLFRRRQGDVYRFALHMTAQPAVADDVTQDTFLAVMHDAARYDPSRATAVAWLCGIARHHVLRRFERDRPMQPLEIDDDAPVSSMLTTTESVLGDLTRAEAVDAVRIAVLTLPIRYREAVVLCDLQELSYADAAAALGCAVGTVRSRLHRGRALLGAKLTAAEAAAQEINPSVSRTVRSDEPGDERTQRRIEIRRANSLRNLA
jgi:RNA polymerase sigma-70 factor (ECF subfamily)